MMYLKVNVSISINVVDITAIQKVDELREELSAQGILLTSACVKQSLSKYFNEGWGIMRKESNAIYRFDTVKSAVRAFNNRVQPKKGTEGLNF